ncbi:MAG: isoamylase early set domain-containing protein [Candidatus Dormibacteraeota bacterium]|nr:isoamylase early set domain-containing protein [Candidatus Dormibacteraeota bacterium]
MKATYQLPVKRLLDGELAPADLPADLRAEGEEALRLIAALNRVPVTLSPALDARVMAAVRQHARSPVRRLWHRLADPREVRLRVRPWEVWGGVLAAAACLALLLTRVPAPVPSDAAAADDASQNAIFVRFVLYAPDAKGVTVAGTFNQWDQKAAPLAPAGRDGVWTTTLALPVGQHQYAFVVDGRRWVVDPAAPAVDDGFGRRNSMVAVTSQGARTL